LADWPAATAILINSGDLTNNAIHGIFLGGSIPVPRGHLDFS
jgi:hypothetical protein